jgi:hypothetical protein
MFEESAKAALFLLCIARAGLQNRDAPQVVFEDSRVSVRGMKSTGGGNWQISYGRNGDRTSHLLNANKHSVNSGSKFGMVRFYWNN